MVINSKTNLNRAIFLDRDGTINRDVGYTHKIDDLIFLPGVIKGLKKLSALGQFKFFIITNQSGIELGKYSEKDFEDFTECMSDKLAEEGIIIEKTYFSTDLPDCPSDMRKPNIGMLKLAQNDYGIDLTKSYVIGDRGSDIETGFNAGCKTILLKSEILKKYPITVQPNAIVDDMLGAAHWIETEENKKSDKFFERKKLQGIVESLKKNKKKIVTINGSFDIIHAGHVHFLREAKKQGDILIVMLNSDSSIKKYKGKDRPINSEKDRVTVMSAFEMVDFVTLFSETTPINTLELIKPDVHVNGAEYGENCIEAKTVKKNGGRLHLVERIGLFSTTNLIKQINKT